LNINRRPLSPANRARYFLGFSDGLTYVLDDHDEEGQLDGEGLLGVKRASDEVSANVRAHDLENRGGNIGVSDSLNMTVADVLIPDL
jgi:hypothetical protein